jgi:hypothetical protein
VSSLDQQYLDFVAATPHIFERYPQLEALRYTFFKEFVIQRRALNWKGVIKHWIRPLAHKNRHTTDPLSRADVLLRIEGQRDTSIDSLARVYKGLQERGVQPLLLASTDITVDLPFARLLYPARRVQPAWAKDAWVEFCKIYPNLNHPGIKRRFLYACAANRGLFEELNRIFDRVQPRSIVLWATQMPVGAAMAVIAKQRGIESILLQHGLLQPFYTPLIADHMITWGESSNQTISELGVPAERLIPLGSPRHDEMRPVGDGKAREAFLQALNLPDRPTLVFFSNGNDLVRNGIAPIECAQWLDYVAEKFQDQFNVVVRLHPNEDGALYTHCPHLTVTKGKPDLATTLEGCDVVGSLCSTVLVEGLLYRKPIWQFYADGWPELADNWRHGLAIRIESRDQLGTMIDHILEDGAGRFFDRNSLRRVFANHGFAAQEIANFIHARLSLLEKKSS